MCIDTLLSSDVPRLDAGTVVLDSPASLRTQCLRWHPEVQQDLLYHKGLTDH